VHWQKPEVGKREENVWVVPVGPAKSHTERRAGEAMWVPTVSIVTSIGVGCVTSIGVGCVPSIGVGCVPSIGVGCVPSIGIVPAAPVASTCAVSREDEKTVCDAARLVSRQGHFEIDSKCLAVGAEGMGSTLASAVASSAPAASPPLSSIAAAAAATAAAAAAASAAAAAAASAAAAAATVRCTCRRPVTRYGVL
jgi:hypothetical protein